MVFSDIEATKDVILSPLRHLSPPQLHGGEAEAPTRQATRDHIPAS